MKLTFRGSWLCKHPIFMLKAFNAAVIGSEKNTGSTRSTTSPDTSEEVPLILKWNKRLPRASDSDNGEDVKTIQETLRHANFKVTMDVSKPSLLFIAIALRSQQEVLLFLKNRKRTLSLHTMNDFVTMEKPSDFSYKILLGDPERISAKLRPFEDNVEPTP